MSGFPTAVQTTSGQIFHLARQIGKGGEGAVYEAAEVGDLALKLYWPDKAKDRREKLTAMASAQWYKTTQFVAFPIDVLFSNGAFVGYIMKKIGGHKPVHLLYSPASRKVEFARSSFPFLVRTASNMSRAVASVHATGCVIGDVNESGFLISSNATSVLIDSDSFQVTSGQKRFLCQVGKPEYTPPELLGARLDQVTRTANHDNFGLAVLVFQLLFMGRHPFAGRFSGTGDMPIERSIAEYRFAYSSQSATTRMKPPPGAPLLTDFPTSIAQAFEAAFGKAGLSGRPTAATWVMLLQNLESELVQCDADGAHHHVKGKPCPWCRMEQASPGFVAFGSFEQAVLIPTQIDVGQFNGILNSIRDPGAWPSFDSIVVAPTNLVAVLAAPGLIRKLKFRALTGIGTCSFGTVLIWYGGGALLPGLVALAVGLISNVFPPRELRQLRAVRSQAEAAFKAVHEAWQRAASSTKCFDLRREATETIRQLTELPTEERRGRDELERKKKELQLYRFLDSVLIRNSKIKKIGSGRKATLASFGIESAAAVDVNKIAAIPGFGPTLISELLAWRQGVVARFVFNPKEPVNPIDLANLKSKIANRKAALEKGIRNSLTALQQECTQSIDQRKKLVTAANRGFEAVKQAGMNERVADGPLQKGSKFISFCCAGMAAIGLMIGPNIKPVGPPSTEGQIRTSERPSEAVPLGTANQIPSSQSPKPLEGPSPLSNSRVQLPPTRELSSSPNPRVGTKALEERPPPGNSRALDTVPAPNSSFSRGSDVAVSPGLDPPSSHAPTLSTPIAPRVGTDASAPKSAPASIPAPSPPVQENSARLEAGKLIPDATPHLDLLVPGDAARVQQKLVGAGFLIGTVDGQWGQKSRHALQLFKMGKNLGNDSTWDARTEAALFGSEASNLVSVEPITLSFSGGWTNSPGACGEPPEAAPLTITPRGASTYAGRCQFDSVRQEVNGVWRVTAVCSSDGKSWPANIRFVVTRSTLKWSSEKGEQVFYRCPERF
jgi:DNA-binding helix-hairpin-helix protein with protein kinase domain